MTESSRRASSSDLHSNMDRLKQFLTQKRKELKQKREFLLQLIGMLNQLLIGASAFLTALHKFFS